MKSLDILHSVDDCLDLTLFPVDGSLFWDAGNWKLPDQDSTDMPQMVDQFSPLDSFEVPYDLRSESGQPQSSWRSVITQRSFASTVSWKRLEALSCIVENATATSGSTQRRILARLQAGDAKRTLDHVPQVQQQHAALDYGQKSDVLFVQRSSCPKEALVDPAQRAEPPSEIVFGSINVPGNMEGMEVELEGVDMRQEVLPASAAGCAISTLPAQAEHVVEPSAA